ncbi:hypothetical protein RUM43_012061 [Polyplax serrata]|uniref:Uncharacterized protein n=1 Tax=Polyplax serrata TaxID=468196 RepID=A0AAN8Q3N1_POLSC
MKKNTEKVAKKKKKKKSEGSRADAEGLKYGKNRFRDRKKREDFFHGTSSLNFTNLLTRVFRQFSNKQKIDRTNCKEIDSIIRALKMKSNESLGQQIGTQFNEKTNEKETRKRYQDPAKPKKTDFVSKIDFKYLKNKKERTQVKKNGKPQEKKKEEVEQDRGNGNSEFFSMEREFQK